MTPVDQIIHARWIAPVEPANTVLHHHAVVIHNGKILALLPSEHAGQQFTSANVARLEHHLLIPGLINSHTHAAMTLMRGFADDLPLERWLQQYIWPTEAQFVAPSYVADGSQLAITEMIRGGTTCFNDMYFFPHATAEAVEAAGIRATIGMLVMDFPSKYARDADDYLQQGIAFANHYENHPLISVITAPHAPYSVSIPMLTQIKQYALTTNKRVHMHLHETRAEVQSFRDQFGCSPIERMDQIGLLDASLIAVHMVHPEQSEIDLLAKRGCHVAHCPESNLKLGNGFCPVTKLIEAGINVAIGTDGAASNNDLDMLGEMRTCAMISKGATRDPQALPAHYVLQMATLNGARALGLDTQIGSLVPGKCADMVAVNLDEPETTPVFDPVSQLVYSCSRHQVVHSWVNGRQIMADRKILTLDEREIAQRSSRWQSELAEFRTTL